MISLRQDKKAKNLHHKAGNQTQLLKFTKTSSLVSTLVVNQILLWRKDPTKESLSPFQSTVHVKSQTDISSKRVFWHTFKIKKGVKCLLKMFPNKDWKCDALKMLIDTTGTVDRRPESGRPRTVHTLSLIHIWRCRRIERCRSRWSPYH